MGGENPEATLLEELEEIPRNPVEVAPELVPAAEAIAAECATAASNIWAIASALLSVELNRKKKRTTPLPAMRALSQLPAAPQLETKVCTGVRNASATLP